MAAFILLTATCGLKKQQEDAVQQHPCYLSYISISEGAVWGMFVCFLGPECSKLMEVAYIGTELILQLVWSC